MKKVFTIVCILILVGLELFTLIKYNLEVEKTQKITNELFKCQSELEKCQKELEDEKNLPEKYLKMANDAYKNQDVTQFVDAYRILEQLDIEEAFPGHYLRTDKYTSQVNSMAISLHNQVKDDRLNDLVKIIKGNDDLKKLTQQRIQKITNAVIAEENELKKLASQNNSDNSAKSVSGKVKIGWTMERCEQALGKPDRKDSFINSDGKSESWYYNNNGVTVCLNFYNGKLESASKIGSKN